MKNKETNYSRRRFLVGALGLVGLLGLGIGGTLYVFNRRTDDNKLLEEFNRETEANIWLEEFPLQIPGAKEIRKYKTDGAGHCLVHILQSHYISRESYDKILLFLSKEEKDREFTYMKNEATFVQKDIYRILSYLVDNLSLNFVYNEGNNKGNINKARQQNFFSNDGVIDEDVLLKFGAPIVLFIEGKIKNIKESETKEMNELAQEEIKKTGSFGPISSDNREDVILKYVCDNNDSFAVVVYGGSHALGGKQSFGDAYSLEGRISHKDNIYEFNLRNPDKKFSLIEVVPSSYRFDE